MFCVILKCMEISSRNNQLVLDIKKQVKDKSLIILDTPKLIGDAISKGVKPKYIFATEKCADMFCGVITTSQSIIDLFSDVKTNAGVVGFIDPIYKELKPPQGNFLVLDRVQDPGNVGTLIRSALGANFKDIYLVDSAKISTKVVRASMGAIFEENLYALTKYEFLKFTKEHNLNLVMADMDGANIYQAEAQKNVGVVLGNEGQGVCDEIASLCKSTIKIPMNKSLESLNVAVSGSIIMFEIEYGGTK